MLAACSSFFRAERSSISLRVLPQLLSLLFNSNILIAEAQSPALATTTPATAPSPLPNRFHHTMNALDRSALFVIGGIAVEDPTAVQTSVPVINTNPFVAYSSTPALLSVPPPGSLLSVSSHTTENLSDRLMLVLFGLSATSPLTFAPSMVYVETVGESKVPTIRTSTSPSTSPSSSAVIPPPRYGHASAVRNDKLGVYVTGGIVRATNGSSDGVGGTDVVGNTSFQQVVDDRIWFLDTATAATRSMDSIDASGASNAFQWRIIPASLPMPVAGHASTTVDRWVVTCFGMSGVNVNLTSECMLFDMTTESFVTPIFDVGDTTRPMPRTSASLVRMGAGTLVAFGGGDYRTMVPGERFMDDLWLLDVSKLPRLRWTRPEVGLATATARAPSQRSGHSAMALRNGELMLITGGDRAKPTTTATPATTSADLTSDLFIFDLKNLNWVDPSTISVDLSATSPTSTTPPSSSAQPSPFPSFDPRNPDIGRPERDNVLRRRIVGVAIGVVLAFAIPLLAFLCLRRRKNDRSIFESMTSRLRAHETSREMRHGSRWWSSRSTLRYTLCVPFRRRGRRRGMSTDDIRLAATRNPTTWHLPGKDRFGSTTSTLTASSDRDGTGKRGRGAEDGDFSNSGSGGVMVTFANSDRVLWSPTVVRDRSSGFTDPLQHYDRDRSSPRAATKKESSSSSEFSSDITLDEEGSSEYDQHLSSDSFSALITPTPPSTSTRNDRRGSAQLTEGHGGPADAVVARPPPASSSFFASHRAVNPRISIAGASPQSSMSSSSSATNTKMKTAAGTKDRDVAEYLNSRLPVPPTNRRRAIPPPASPPPTSPLPQPPSPTIPPLASTTSSASKS